MRTCLLLFTCLFSLVARSQTERDTVLRRCPIAITDTVSSNNFFIEGLPATLKVYRVKGKLTIQFEQREQFFTIFFHEKKLRKTTYTIAPGSRSKSEVEATYSFRSGGQASVIPVSSGSLQVTQEAGSTFWRVKLNGMIANLVERSVTYYRARGEWVVL